MPDIAKIGLQADSSSVRTAKNDLRDLGQQAGKTERETLALGDATRQTGSGFEALGSAARIATGLVGGFLSVLSVDRLIRSLTDASMEMQRIQFTMQQVFGAGGSTEFDTIATTADKLGLSLKGAAQGYAMLAASAQGTRARTEDLQKLFVGLSSAATVLHASTSDVNGVLVQLSQGLSFGKLQMQDIRAIAQHLPGTMTILQEAARRLGTTLENSLAHGGLDAAKAIGVIGDVMQERFGGQAVAASHSLNAELNRLHNTIFTMLADGNNFETAFSTAIRNINATLQSADFQQAFATIADALGEAAIAAAKGFALLADNMKLIGEIALSFAVLAGVAATLRALAVAVDIATVAFVALRTAVLFFTGPAGWIVAAVAGLGLAGAAIYDHLTAPAREAAKAIDGMNAAVERINGSIPQLTSAVTGSGLNQAFQKAFADSAKAITAAQEAVAKAPAGDTQAQAKLEELIDAQKRLVMAYQTRTLALDALAKAQKTAGDETVAAATKILKLPLLQRVKLPALDTKELHDNIAEMGKLTQAHIEALRTLQQYGDASQKARGEVGLHAEALAGLQREVLPALRAMGIEEAAAQDLIEKRAQKMAQGVKSSYDQMSQFAIQAARNMQDAFANFLFDPFQGGLKGMLTSFVNILRQMAAQAAASAIFTAIGQAATAGKLGSMAASLAGMFGGARASGGPVNAGTPYLVGERGPEIVVPRAAGTVIPNHGIGGGGTTFNVSVSYVEQAGKTSSDRQRDRGDFMQELQRTLRQSWQQMAQEDMARNGPVTRAYAGTFGLRRATVNA